MSAVFSPNLGLVVADLPLLKPPFWVFNIEPFILVGLCADV